MFLSKAFFWLTLWGSGWPKNMCPLVCYSSFLSVLEFSIISSLLCIRHDTYLQMVFCYPVCMSWGEKNKSFICETASSCPSLFFCSSSSLKWLIPFVFYSLQGIWMSHLIGSLQPSFSEDRMDFISFCFVIYLVISGE